MISPPRIGSGGTPSQSWEKRYITDGIEVVIGTADIKSPTDWTKLDKFRDCIILHLNGQMDVLETELEEAGGSSGPANIGEIWSVPKGKRYSSHAVGDQITFAEIHFDRDIDNELIPVAGYQDAALLNELRKLLPQGQQNPKTLTQRLLPLQAETIRHRIDRYLTRSVSSNHADELTLSNRQTRLAREFIYEHLSESIQLSDLARILKLTPHHLLKSFRKAFGTTPGQFIIAQRVRDAQRRLLHSSDDITTIALDCGFSSHSHLTNVFHRRAGCSPKDFREKYKS